MYYAVVCKYTYKSMIYTVISVCYLEYTYTWTYNRHRYIECRVHFSSKRIKITMLYIEYNCVSITINTYIIYTCSTYHCEFRSGIGRCYGSSKFTRQ